MNRVFTSVHRFCCLLIPASAVLLLTAPAAAQTPPAAPDNLAATVLDGPQVELTWNDNSNSEHYFFIYRSLSPDGPFDWWDIAPADATSYVDGTYYLVGGPIYYYRVTAFDELYGLESEVSNTAEAELPVGVPRAPSAFEGSVDDGTTVYFAWEDAAWNEDEFIISCSTTGPNGTYNDVATESANIGYHVLYAAPPCATLYYKIRTSNSYGDSNCVGPLMVQTGEWQY